MFYRVSVHDFLPRAICSVLNCCVVLRRPAKIEVLRICCGGLRSAGAETEPERSTAAAGGNTHIDSNGILSAAETQPTRIWWKLAVGKRRYQWPPDKIRALIHFRATNEDKCTKSKQGPKNYGSTSEPPDETLTVVAIVVPIILSACIILSCYCFRRHSSIICPIIPDPSAIFKEMMMNGNKEVKTAEESLYTPMPEPVESCKITLIAENGILQQNS